MNLSSPSSKAIILLFSFVCLSACESNSKKQGKVKSSKLISVKMSDSLAMAAICSGKRIAVSYLEMGPNAGDTASVDTVWTWMANTSQIKKRYPNAKLNDSDNSENVDYSILNTIASDSIYVLSYLGEIKDKETSRNLGSSLGIISFAKRNGTWVMLNNNFNVLAAVGNGNIEYSQGWIGKGGVNGSRVLTAVVVPENDDDRTLLFDQFGKVDEDASLKVAMDERSSEEQRRDANAANAASNSQQAAAVKGQTTSEESHQTSAGRQFVVHWSKRLPRYTTQSCDTRFYQNQTLYFSETMTVPQGKVWIPLYGMSCPSENSSYYSPVQIESDEQSSQNGCYFGTLYKLPDNNNQKNTDRALHEFKRFYGGTKVKFWGFVAYNEITMLEQSGNSANN